jgi:hypothetical protein
MEDDAKAVDSRRLYYYSRIKGGEMEAIQRALQRADF